MLVGSQVARFNTAPSPRVFSMEHAENALEFAEGYDYIADPWQAQWLRTDELVGLRPPGA